jgi:hypothetical protein
MVDANDSQVAEIDPVEVTLALSGMLPADKVQGPAMKRLTERQQMFVVALLDLGCSHARAARAAGYSTSSELYLRVQGFRLAHNPVVQAALLEEAKKRVTAGTAAAVNLVMRVMGDEKVADKVRLKAAEMILDRGGLHGVHEARQTGDGEGGGRAEKMLRLAMLAKLLGVDPRQVMGNLADGLVGDEKLIEQNPAADVDLTSGGSAPVPATQPAGVVDDESETGA